MNTAKALESLDRMPVPTDLWSLTIRRTSEFIEGSPAPPSLPPLRRRRPILALLLALAASTSAIVLVVIAFRPGSPSSPGETGLPATAELRCDENGIHAITPSVLAQQDGIHLTIENELAFDPGLSVLFEGGGFGENLEPRGTKTFTAQIPPGDARLTCGNQATGSPSSAVIRIVDTYGFYVSPVLQCAGATANLGAAPASGEVDEAVAREALASILRPGDKIQVAGYPLAVPRLMRAVRGSEAIAVVTLVRTGGLWTSDDAVACEDLLQ